MSSTQDKLVRVSFKDSDAFGWIDNSELPLDLRTKFCQYGEYALLEFNVTKQTCRVVPVAEIIQDEVDKSDDEKEQSENSASDS